MYVFGHFFQLGHIIIHSERITVCILVEGKEGTMENLINWHRGNQSLKIVIIIIIIVVETRTKTKTINYNYYYPVKVRGLVNQSANGMNQ